MLFHIGDLMPRPPLLKIILASLCMFAASTARADRTTVNFDGDWRFFQGEPPAPAPAQPLSGNYAPIDPASFAFKDDDWRKVNLPHDWAIEGPFDEKNPSNAAGAFLPSGVAWYRKTFAVPAEAKGKRVFIEFDGVMANSEVYLNKSLLGSRPNGYVTFRYDLTDALNYAGPNLIAVRTDTSRQPASRWYTGAGINRHVRMVIQNPVHFEYGSSFVTTLTRNAIENYSFASVQTNLRNDSDTPVNYELSLIVKGPDGSTFRESTRTVGNGDHRPVTDDNKSITIPAHSSVKVASEIRIPVALLWTPDSPHLYQCTLSLTNASGSVDEESIPFGIRTAEFRADTGFWLNGKNIKLLGVALHSDAGALGTAVPASAWKSRLAALKARGVNAIRTAHNPPPPELLDACDRLGLMVMDEAFDAWTVAKEPGDYHLYFKDWWQRDLAAMMQRDRNHPSVVIWSLGNEIWDILPQNPDPAADQFIGPNRSIDLAKGIFGPMKELAHQLDPTRPVTIAEMRANVAGAYTNGFADMMDVIGQNYRDNELAAAHRQNPQRKIIGTEDYKTRDTWIALRDNPALSGQFLWAGVDYLGESGAWPNVVSPSGILDRTNFPRGEALEREAWWSTKPVVHIVRMQSMPTRPGRAAVAMGVADWTPAAAELHNETVDVYSNCDEVELFLNDKSLGAKPKDPGDNPRQWQVSFTPGTLRAIAKNKGAQIATDELKTAGAAAKIVLQAEQTSLPNDWDDVVYVRAILADSNGIPNPRAAAKIKFAVSGPGTVIAVDNGDVASHEPFQATERSTYEGSCIAIVRATANSGKITLTASAAGIADGTVEIDAAPPVR